VIRLRPAAERGTISLELAILALPMIMLMMLVWAFGVFAQAVSVCDQAARDAVRAATQTRSPDTAREAMERAIDQTIDDAEYVGQFIKTPADYTPDLDDFPPQPIFSQDEMATVSITLRCEVDMRTASIIQLGTKTVESEYVSPLDSYRGYYQ
jgi:Flp pilus assembly protein TadG